MKKLSLDEASTIVGGGAVCDFVGGLVTGWGVGAILVGGAAAASGGALALVGVGIGIYCAGKNSA
jgi:hypothetical protein|nr:hypothetical protein [uncultured Emticicia sp.]